MVIKCKQSRLNLPLGCIRKYYERVIAIACAFRIPCSRPQRLQTRRFACAQHKAICLRRSTRIIVGEANCRRRWCSVQEPGRVHRCLQDHGSVRYTVFHFPSLCKRVRTEIIPNKHNPMSCNYASSYSHLPSQTFTQAMLHTSALHHDALPNSPHVRQTNTPHKPQLRNKNSNSEQSRESGGTPANPPTHVAPPEKLFCNALTPTFNPAQPHTTHKRKLSIGTQDCMQTRSCSHTLQPGLIT